MKRLEAEREQRLEYWASVVEGEEARDGLEGEYLSGGIARLELAGRGSGGEADEQEKQEVQEVRWLIEDNAEDERVRWWRGIGCCSLCSYRKEVKYKGSIHVRWG